MSGLVEFLRARLDEDKETAQRAASYDDGARHDVQGPAGTWECLDESEWFGASYRGGVIAPRIGYANAPELGAHIVRHHPARTLAVTEAKRKILNAYEKWQARADAGEGLSQFERGALAGLYSVCRILAEAEGWKP